MQIFLDKNWKRGLSYVETIVSVAIFAAVATMLYTTYERVYVVARAGQARVDAVALADEQFEVARNLPFSRVGTVGGIPAGVMKQVQTLTRSGMIFIATTTVRNIDQPFDGTAGGMPNDLSPEDNKLVEIDINCITCRNFRPMVLTTWIGPKDLEGTSTNGSLFVQAIDSNGLAVSGASVNIIATSTNPTVNISDITATSGLLQLVGTPPANEGYQVTVSKGGYSTEQTYGRTATTANPVKPNATVIAQTVTQLTFAIDRTATINFSSVSPSCGVVPNVNLHMSGTKLIANPSTLKYDKWMKTDAGGLLALNDIEWDSYTLAATSSAYELAGVVPLQPFTIAPGAVQNVQVVMMPKTSPSVLITVKDAGTGLPVTGATVTLDKSGATTTLTTGRGFLSQTDWSGGSGQSMYTTANQYATDDGNTDAITTVGQVKLLNTLGVYQANGVLYSSTFDTGSVSNFYQFLSQPTNQPAAVGLTPVRFQLATSNSTSSPWVYLGPDGTSATYYNATTTDIAAVNNGYRYLRYKMLLSTASTSYTPSVSDIQFTFTSSCVPPGQVLFQGLSTGTYNVTVSKTGYTTANDTVTVTAGSWQEKPINIGP